MRISVSSIATSSDERITYWVNRHGTQMDRWSGVPPGANASCACGLNGSCQGPGRRKDCNCNANDYVMRSDEGYVTAMEDLPITKYCVGDTGENQENFFIFSKTLFQVQNLIPKPHSA